MDDKKELPYLSPADTAKMLCGSMQDILEQMGVVCNFKIQHETNRPIDNDALLKAVTAHTQVLAYIIPRYGLTELYIKARLAEQEQLEKQANEKVE
jgi:hypothetical protein